MKFKIFLSISLMLCCSTSYADKLATYSGWLIGEKYYVYEDNSNSLVLNYGGDEPNKVYKCDSDKKYYCFFTRRLAFVFPKNLSSTTVSWSVKGVTFELLESGKNISFFGKDISNVFLIKTPYSATLAGQQHKKDTYWLYSKKYGVLGFGYKRNNQVYWLEGDKGIGL